MSANGNFLEQINLKNKYKAYIMSFKLYIGYKVYF